MEGEVVMISIITISRNNDEYLQRYLKALFKNTVYPDWELIERYMILYCANHHGVFHRYRGDKYANFIGANTIRNGGS